MAEMINLLCTTVDLKQYSVRKIEKLLLFYSHSFKNTFANIKINKNRITLQINHMINNSFVTECCQHKNLSEHINHQSV